MLLYRAHDILDIFLIFNESITFLGPLILSLDLPILRAAQISRTVSLNPDSVTSSSYAHAYNCSIFPDPASWKLVAVVNSVFYKMN